MPPGQHVVYACSGGRWILWRLRIISVELVHGILLFWYEVRQSGHTPSLGLCFSPFLRSRGLAMARVSMRLPHATRRSSSCETQSVTITATLMSRIWSYLRICVHVYTCSRVGRCSDRHRQASTARTSNKALVRDNQHNEEKFSLEKKKREKSVRTNLKRPDERSKSTTPRGT